MTPDKPFEPLIEHANEDVLDIATHTLAGAPDTALATLGDLIAGYPNDSRLFLLRGAVFASLACFDDARCDLERCVSIDPCSHVSWFMLGFIRLLHGQLEEAKHDWKNLSDLVPDNTLRRLIQGLELLVADRFQEARADLNATLECNADYLILNPFISNLLAAIDTQTGAAAAPEHSEHHLMIAGYLANSTRH